MAKYFILTSDTWYNPKNRLEEDIQDFFNSKSRLLLSGPAGKEVFLGDLRKGLSELHAKHPRCKERMLEHMRELPEIDPGHEKYSISQVGSINIYEVKDISHV